MEFFGAFLCGDSLALWGAMRVEIKRTWSVIQSGQSDAFVVSVSVSVSISVCGWANLGPKAREEITLALWHFAACD